MHTVPFKPLYFNDNLTNSCDTEFLTQTKELFMKQLLLAPIYFAILIFLMACLSGAHAAQGLIIEFDNPTMTREERIIKNIVDRNKGIDLTVREKTYVHDTVDAIADREYADKVQRVNGLKPGEHYEGQ